MSHVSVVCRWGAGSRALRGLSVAFFASSETNRAEEDAERDRQDGAVAQKGARAAGYRHRGEGYETPGGQFHARESLRPLRNSRVV